MDNRIYIPEQCRVCSASIEIRFISCRNKQRSLEILIRIYGSAALCIETVVGVTVGSLIQHVVIVFRYDPETVYNTGKHFILAVVQ
ncbi:hypothetical protein Barb6XT_02694 [Bacteroidales bacterium Barb6XT]|nr:hypothetical protein Barb6XT_02694 [Bacteroidales bacterium Barb6XT]